MNTVSYLRKIGSSAFLLGSRQVRMDDKKGMESALKTMMNTREFQKEMQSQMNFKFNINLRG